MVQRFLVQEEILAILCETLVILHEQIEALLVVSGE